MCNLATKWKNALYHKFKNLNQRKNCICDQYFYNPECGCYGWGCGTFLRAETPETKSFKSDESRTKHIGSESSFFTLPSYISTPVPPEWTTTDKILLSTTLYVDGSQPFTASIAPTVTTLSKDDTTLDTTPYTTHDAYTHVGHTMANSYRFRPTGQPGVYNGFFSDPLYSITGGFNHRHKRNVNLASKSANDSSAILIFLLFLWNAF